jgi:hypothetical protein
MFRAAQMAAAGNDVRGLRAIDTAGHRSPAAFPQVVN